MIDRKRWGIYSLMILLSLLLLASCTLQAKTSTPSKDTSPISLEEEESKDERDVADIAQYTDEEMSLELTAWDVNGMNIRITYDGETLDKDHPEASFGKLSPAGGNTDRFVDLDYHPYQVELFGAKSDDMMREIKIRRYLNDFGGVEERLRYEIPYTTETVIRFDLDLRQPTTTLYVDQNGDGTVDETLVMDDEYHITHGPEAPPYVSLDVQGWFAIRVEHEGEILDLDHPETSFGSTQVFNPNGIDRHLFWLNPTQEYDVYLKATRTGELSVFCLEWGDKYLNILGAVGLYENIKVKKGQTLYFHLSDDIDAPIILYLSSKGNQNYDKSYELERGGSFSFQWK